MAKIQIGMTGAWVAFGLRTDEFPIEVFDPFSGDCLDAPEVICCGSTRVPYGETALTSFPTFFYRGE